MIPAEAVRARERLMVRLGTTFAEIAVEIHEAPRPEATVFCLHDFFGNGQDFRPLAATLVANRYRVISPDMPGRGDSVYFDDPEYYRPVTYLRTLMGVMQRFADSRIIIVGKGWGALLALLLNTRVNFELERLVVSDVPLLWSVNVDTLPRPELAAGADLAAARDGLVASPEFAGMRPERAAELAAGRLRQAPDGTVSLAYDPSIIEPLRRFAENALDTASLLKKLGVPLLYLTAGRLSDGDRQALDAVGLPPGSVRAEELRPGGRVHFTSSREQVLLLRFLKGVSTSAG